MNTETNKPARTYLVQSAYTGSIRYRITADSPAEAARDYTRQALSDLHRNSQRLIKLQVLVSLQESSGLIRQRIYDATINGAELFTGADTY